MNLSESSKGRGLLRQRQSASMGWGVLASQKHPTPGVLLRVAGIQGPACQTRQGVLRKVMLAASESAAGGFSRSHKEELRL